MRHRIPLSIALLAIVATATIAAPSQSPAPSASTAVAMPLAFDPDEFSPKSEGERSLLKMIATVMMSTDTEAKAAAYRTFFTEYPTGKFKPVAVGAFVKAIKKLQRPADELLTIATDLSTHDPSVGRADVAALLLRHYCAAKGDPAKALAVLDEQAKSKDPAIAWKGAVGGAMLLASTGKRKEALDRLEARPAKDLEPAMQVERDYVMGRILHDLSTTVTGAERVKMEDTVRERFERVATACEKDAAANAGYSSAFIGLARIGLSRPDAKLAKSAYERVAKLYPATPEAAEAGMLGPQIELLGQPAPAFEGPGLDGKPITSKILEGKISLVDFWATTCAPCKLEAPNLARLARDSAKRPFAIVSISLDLPERKEAIEAFTKATGIEWPQIYDGKGFQSPLPGKWHVNAMPSMFVVDEKGIVIRVGLDGPALREAVEAELSRLESSQKK